MRANADEGRLSTDWKIFFLIAKAERGTYSQNGTIASRVVIGEVDVENQGVVVAETWIGGEKEKWRHSIYPPYNKINKKSTRSEPPLLPV